jgi:hypothetical protein
MIMKKEYQNVKVRTFYSIVSFRISLTRTVSSKIHNECKHIVIKLQSCLSIIFLSETLLLSVKMAQGTSVNTNFNKIISTFYLDYNA